MGVGSRVNIGEALHDKLLLSLGLSNLLIILFFKLQSPIFRNLWLSLLLISQIGVVLEDLVALINIQFCLIAEVIRDHTLNWR